MAYATGGHAWVLAFADRIPNLEARALSPTIGWLALTCLLAFAALCVLHRDRWRRLWLRAEDPRTMGALRIAFGIALLLNLAGMWEHLEFLFTDEGLFSTEAAREVLARKQFAGFGEGARGEPTGFFDAAGVFAFLEGPRYSLLFFRSDPTFFWIHLWVYVAVVISFTIGFGSRTSGVLAFLLMGSIVMRNPIYWTGADLVYRVFFFLLMLARTGNAYSVDNWLRCRRLRREQRLSERGGPGGGAGLPPSDAHTRGLEPIYRRIPAWPRLLMILQLATIYFYTGCAKTGRVWQEGDSLYYALNLDHFYRMPPQFLASIFGTNVFRLFSWVVHYWQIAFPLMIVGLVTRWSIREGFTPAVGVRTHATRALWAIVGFSALGVVLTAYPVHYTQSPGWPSTATMQLIIGTVWVSAMGLGAWLWRRLRDRPLQLRIRRFQVTIGLEQACTWLLGRRLWLSVGLFFHVQIFVMMNIGMFAPIMIVGYLCCLNGTETASILRSLGRVAARLHIPGVPPAVAEGEAATPPADRMLDPARREGLPEGAAPWAYGRLGRVLASSFVVVHITAVALWCTPDKDSCHAFRKPVRAFVEPYLKITNTQQSWSMFAPNPPRSNSFLNVMVTDSAGEVWDLHADANSPRNKAQPWIFYDRAGKITRRINGEGKQYRRWLARYHCRRWALEHGGELPHSVELIKVWYSIPKPEALRRHGYYTPADRLERVGHEDSLLTVRCATERDAQPTDEIRARHGLPPAEPGTIRHHATLRQAAWQRLQAKRAE